MMISQECFGRVDEWYNEKDFIHEILKIGTITYYQQLNRGNFQHFIWFRSKQSALNEFRFFEVVMRYSSFYRFFKMNSVCYIRIWKTKLPPFAKIYSKSNLNSGKWQYFRFNRNHMIQGESSNWTYILIVGSWYHRKYFFHCHFPIRPQ